MRRQVVYGIGPVQAHALVVDDVQIRLHAGGQEAAVAQANELRTLGAQRANDFRQGDAFAAAAVARPVGDHESRQAGIADVAAVRPAVAEAEDRGGVHQHLTRLGQIAESVVEQRAHEDRPSIVHEHLVVGELVGSEPVAPGRGCNAVFRPGLVVGGVPQQVDAVQVGRPLHLSLMQSRRIKRAFGEDLLAHFRCSKQGAALRQRQVGNGRIGRMVGEGIHAQVQPHEHADGPTADLAGDFDVLGPAFLQQAQHLAPAFGPRVLLQQQYRDGPAGGAGHLAEVLEVLQRIVEFGHQLEQAGTRVLQSLGQ